MARQRLITPRRVTAASSASLIGCDEVTIASVLQSLGCHVLNFLATYLVLPLYVTLLSKIHLQPYVDRGAGHLPTWKASML